MQAGGVKPWEELALLGLHYCWYLGIVFSFLPIWKGLLFVVLSQVGRGPGSDALRTWLESVGLLSRGHEAVHCLL